MAADNLATEGRIKLPGFGLPLEHLPGNGVPPIGTSQAGSSHRGVYLGRPTKPQDANSDTRKRLYFPIFSTDTEESWKGCTHLIREACMLKVIEELTNKPEWWRKVRDEEIASKWKKEMLEMDWKKYRQFADFTHDMAETCIRELRQKAELYESTGLVPVMDTSAAVIKSDNIITDDLKAALLVGAKPLEDVPDSQKDWHPGSDGRVLDLVHPSLWPLIYGRSRILPDKRIGISDCLAHSGMGEIVPSPIENRSADVAARFENHYLSTNYQWLPCDVELSEEGNAKIVSYINNLHPVKHQALYPVIEKFIEKALPAWDVLYQWPDDFDMQRLQTNTASKDCKIPEVCDESEIGCDPWNRPIEPGEPEKEDEYAPFGHGDTEQGKKDLEWFHEYHPVMLPEATPDKVPEIKLKASDVKSKGFFDNASRFQVIVKLANIHLTPEKPEYGGGTWHVEGQLNEHICATALFYYDSDNITDCHLDFRHLANREDLTVELGYEQDDRDSIKRIFDLDPWGHAVQDVGSVLTRPGRALFFPNLFQHHVSPFSLVDKNKPGHRKILALFLVDPAIPIISTANVPPQRQDWWSEATSFESGEGYRKLPLELKEMVMQGVDFPIALGEAERIREDLMKERGG